MARDPRFCDGAYVRYGERVWRVLGQERTDRGHITGYYVLEDICTYERNRVMGFVISNQYKLVRVPPSVAVEHLDAAMDVYLRSVGVATSDLTGEAAHG